MVNNNEQRQPGQSTVRNQQDNAQDIQEQLVVEIREVADNQLEQRKLGKKLIEAVRDAEVSAAEQRQSTQLSGRGGPKVEASERQGLKKNLIRVLKGVEEGVVEVPSEANKAILLQLNSKVGRQLSNDNSAFLQPIIAKLLESNQSVADLQVQFAQLQHDWGVPELVQKVSDAVVGAAEDGKLAVSGEQAREMFNTDTVEQPRSQDGEGIDAQTWGTYFQSFFGDDPDDRKVIEALYSPQKLKSYVDERKTKAIDELTQANNRVPKNDEVWRRTSEDVEREIVLRFSKLYLRVDKQRPNEPFEQIAAQGGLYDSIQIVEIQMKRALEQLGERISRMSPEEYGTYFGEMKFFRRFSKQDLDEKLVEKKEVRDSATGEIIQHAGTKTVRQYRIQPAAGIKQVENVQEFLDDVHTMVEHEVATRGYLHNVKLAFARPAGDGGFWGALSRYAEQMPSTDIDSMMHLPDNHLFMSAYRMYVKYLEEEFALIDWKHQPNMFSPDFFNNKTAIEQKVRIDLKRMFPELRSEMNWRLDRAMSMGIGLAKGVLLTEAEIAAYAEPHLNFENNKATYTSIYTNDATATATLNPQHHFLRWQTEGANRGPLIFLPLIGMGGGADFKFMRGNWDHRVLWESAQRFRDSYMNGQSSFENRPGGEKLFIDYLPNFAKVGGYFTRGGWRSAHEIAGSLHWEGTDRKLNVLKSWKALENVGYEALLPLIAVEGFSQTPELQAYLFEKYINPGGSLGMSLSEYMNSLRGKDEKDRDSLFINHVFTHLLVQRLPTKLIRLERDRQSASGVRIWERVRNDLGIDANQMNSRMQNLMMVESKVREETSKKMNKSLQDQGGVQDLSTADIDDYKVDEPRIRSVLQTAGTDAVEIEATVQLFNKIQDLLFQGNIGSRYIDEFALKLKNKDFPFAIGTEEVDPSFLALRGAGQRVLARALGDTGKVETEVYGAMTKYIDMLQPLSLDPKHDIHKLIETLELMHTAIDQIHGHTEAARVVTAMASLTIAYFKKDTFAKNVLTKAFSVGRTNSLAAEFAGKFSGVWEWELPEIDNFISQLERRKLLPKEALNLADEGVVKISDKKFLGIIPYKKTSREKSEHAYMTGKELRKNFGGSAKDIGIEMASKYLPLFLIFMLYTLITKALKETQDKK